MAGIYGGHPEDQYFAAQLAEHQAAEDVDEECSHDRYCFCSNCMEQSTMKYDRRRDAET
jgi:hypothetical protein